MKKAVQQKEVKDTIIIKTCSRDPTPSLYEYVKGGGGIFNDMAVNY